MDNECKRLLTTVTLFQLSPASQTTQAPQKFCKSRIAARIFEDRVAPEKRDVLTVAFFVSSIEPFSGAILIARERIRAGYIASSAIAAVNRGVNEWCKVDSLS